MAETKMQLVDWLDDLCVRFIINLPQEELQSVERICFQVEEAQWFYEDFVRPLDATLPSLSLRQFCLLIFQHCPLLAPFPPEQHIAAFDEFLAYKVRVPVRGAIMLNEAMDQVVLVKGWKKGANWSFPRGKINKAEDDLDCAIREVYEETGFDIAMAGVVPVQSEQKYIEVTMREQHMKMFVFKGVPQDTMFAPRTRKEISKIQWYDLASLPGWRKTKNKQGDPQQETLKANKFYMVAPFLQPLKRWINEQKKRTLTVPDTSHEQYATDEAIVHDLADVHSSQALLSQAHQQIHEAPSTGAGDLMALLRGQQAAVLKQSPTSPAVPHPDAADRLKHLLSVGQSLPSVPSVPLPKDRDAGATDLLAMLRQGSTAMLEPKNQHTGPPKTPVDQIANIAYPPKRPSHHHRPSSHTTPNRPPPDFAYSPARIAQQQAQHANAGYGPPQQPFFAPLQPTHIAWNAPQQSQQAARPFERTGDPQFARDVMPVPQVSSVPSANQLPAPNLSSHAMNLLNAFKSSAKPSIMSPPPQHPATAQRLAVPTSIAPVAAVNPSAAVTNGASLSMDSRARQALVPQPSGNVFSPGLPQSPPRNTGVPALQGKRSDAHKSSLLTLLRTPSAMAPEALLPPTLEPPPQPDLSELATQMKPHREVTKMQILAREEPIVEQNTAHGQRSQGHSSTQVDVMQPKVTTKTPDTHNTGTVRRKPRAKAELTDSPGMSDSSVGVTSVSNKKPRNGSKRELGSHSMVRPMPIQILKRPVAPSQSELPVETSQKRPITPAATTTVGDQVKPITPKQFQPQILRRPQGATPTTSVELPTATTPEAVSNKPEPQVTERTKALLSLFNQPQTVKRPEQPSSAIQSPPAVSSVVKPDLLTLLKNNKPATVAPSGEQEDSEITPEMPEQTKATPAATTSKTALLSLFGTNMTKQQAPEATVSPVVEQRKPSVATMDAQNSLLGLFKKPTLPASAMLSNMKPTSPTETRPGTFDRRPSSKVDHQASLLSLFGQARPSSSSVEVGSSAILSPVSATPMAFPPRRTTPGVGGTTSDFKRASTASGVSAQGQDESMRSRMNSTTSRDGIGSGSQTPISSTDRGFLLKYLNGL